MAESLPNPMSRRLIVEAIGSALVLAVVVGSRVMGDRLSGGMAGVTFLVNTAAVGCVFVSLLLTFGPISGGHFNPAVSFAAWLRGRMSFNDAAAYIAAQLTGAFVGVGVTLLVFGKPVFNWSNPPRATVTEVAGEFLAAFGLLCVVSGGTRLRLTTSAFAVGAYLSATYWFTESTSFANPAVTIAKGLTSTSSSIQPRDIGMILTTQLLGAACAGLLFRWLSPSRKVRRKRALVVFACPEDPALSRRAVQAFRQYAAPDRATAVAGTPFPLQGDADQPDAGEPLVALEDAQSLDADLIVTIGSDASWEPLTDSARVHWSLPTDPRLHPEPVEGRRADAAELLRARVRMLVRELGLERMQVVVREQR